MNYVGCIDSSKIKQLWALPSGSLGRVVNENSRVTELGDAS